MRFALRIIAVSMLLLVGFKASAQALCTCIRGMLKAGDVRGRVVATDKQGAEEPIPNATVKLLKCLGGDCQTVAEVTADGNGRFSIEGVTSGEYEIVASAKHFERIWVKLKVRGKPENKKEMVFALAPGLDCCGGWAKVRKIK